MHRSYVKKGGIVSRGGVQNALSQVIGADHDGGPGLEVKEDGNIEVISHRQNPEHGVFASQF